MGWRVYGALFGAGSRKVVPRVQCTAQYAWNARALLSPTVCRCALDAGDNLRQIR